MKNSMHSKQTSIDAFFLTGFGVGWMPVAPGTWGAALGVLLAMPVTAFLPAVWANALLSLCVLFCVWAGARASARMEPSWGKDPKQTVIDEVAGQWIALLGIPLTWPYWLAGFFLFRAFDIFKPLGIRRLERIGQGWGVMLDDVLAGVYANIVLQFAFYFDLLPTIF